MASRRQLLIVAGVFCTLNAGFVLGMGAMGSLETWGGSVTYHDRVATPDGEFVLSDDSTDRFVDDNPSDANAFYNAVVLIRNGGPLYPVVNPPIGWEPTVQVIYQYAPAVIFFYYLLFVLANSYLQFKLLVLFSSGLAVVIGTYLLLRAELSHRDMEVSQYAIMGAAVLSLGFQPMITNFKTGQSSPFIFLNLAASWYLYRHRSPFGSGVALTGAVLFKPYTGAPLVALFDRHRSSALTGFLGALLVANLLALLAFDAATVLDYYRRLFVVATSSDTSNLLTIEQWTSSNHRPFFFLGPFATVAYVVVAVPLATAIGLHLLNEVVRPLELFALALATLMLSLPSTTGVDLGILLAVVILLGITTYGRDTREFELVFAAFLLLMAHEHVLEALVGIGPEYADFLATNKSIVLATLPVTQTATSGCLLLVAVAFRPYLMSLREEKANGRD